jgi:phosphomannomutase
VVDSDGKVGTEAARVAGIFGAYDIRGVVGDDLDSVVARRIGRAYGDHLRPGGGGRFLIGHDARRSSPALAEAFSVGLREGGHRVTHLGLATTPMTYWVGAEGRYDGSVTVTASHLPPAHNGFKLCRHDAIPLSVEDGLPQILAAVVAPEPPPAAPTSEDLGRVEALSHYASRLGAHLRPARRLRVAVDAGNGVGGADTLAVLQGRDDVELVAVGLHPDGGFPNRSANPLDPGATDRLGQLVVAHGCDLGVAYDGDADRAVAVDELGQTLTPDAFGALLATWVLAAHPGATVLYDLRASRALPEAIEAAGGVAVRTRVGHAYVKPGMRRHDAAFAAELSGHYYYRDLHFTDNGLRSLIELANLVAAADRPLSALAAPLGRYALSGEVNLTAADPAAVLAGLAPAYADGRQDHLDGLSVDYDDWWFNVRASNTEPVVRVNVGALSAEILAAHLGELLARVRSWAGLAP